MKKCLCAIILSGFLSGHLYSQVYTTEWVNQYGNGNNENILFMDADTNGGSVFLFGFESALTIDIAGTSETFSSPGDASLLMLTDKNGTNTWARLYQGNSYSIREIDVSDQNLIFVVGTFSGTFDLDPGPVTSNVTSPGASFLQAFDDGGNLLWYKIFTGSGIYHVQADDNGNIFLSFTISNSGSGADLDPGPGSVMVNPVNKAIALVKLDASGNFLWHNLYSGTSNNWSHLTYAQDKIYCYGYFEGTYDFDPTAGTDMETSIGLADCYINKVDATTGNIIWSKRFGGATGSGSWDRNSISHVIVDADENLYMTGQYSSNLDVDPGPAVNQIPGFCNDCSNLFASKLNSSGNHIWSYYVLAASNTSQITPCGIHLTNQNTLILGSLNEVFSPPFIFDFDNGPGTFNISSTNGGYSFMHLDTTGNFFWSEFSESQWMLDYTMVDDTATVFGGFSIPLNFGSNENPINLSPAPLTGLPFLLGDAFLKRTYFNFNGLSGHVFTTPVSETGSCNAEAYANVIGGFPPYSYNWIGQPDADQLSELDSACYGIHTLLITDIAGDSAFVDYYVTDSANYYTPVITVTPQDTVYLEAENCLLDYTLPVDSAFMASFLYLYDDTLSTDGYYEVNIIYFQSGNAYAFSDTVLVSSDEDVLFFFAVYCPFKTVGDNKIFLFLTDVGTLSSGEILQPLVCIFPNPVNNQFAVTGINYDEIYLTDLSGRMVCRFDPADTYNVSDLGEGIYLVNLLENGTLIEQLKLVRVK